MSDPNGPTDPYATPPAGAAPYGAYGSPMPPPSYGAPPVAAGPAPSTVVRTFWLMITRVVLSIIALIVALNSRSTIRSMIIKQHSGYSQHQIDTAVNGTIAALVAGALVFAVLYVLLALQVRKGKNWARIVTWVLAGIGVLSFLASMGNTTLSGASKAIGVVDGLIDIAIIVLLIMSNDYFRRRA